ncbi:hypothetical protein COO60DRAFT_1698288 [Scenedesmus sp. NREL 46B-D3]|nr:hypothetical protein COO60DRAFT_1698288 [Scenedesmus sp. NREL 46B-D3]
MLRTVVIAAALLLLLLLCPATHAQSLDKLSDVHQLSDAQLEQFLEHTVRWLGTKALDESSSPLEAFVEQLRLVLQPVCTHCINYFQAVALVRGLSKSVQQVLEEGRNDVYYPAVRRSYVAAIWLLQRSKMFVWQTTHLERTALGTMLRLYLHHVKRAQGRTISFHHISKCGGTTMCQLAAKNRCSNPHLTIEQNCVMDDRLDSPVWMLSHHVNASGAFPDTSRGLLDVTPRSPVDAANYNRHERATEPQLSMWLMYACPHLLNGRPHTCQSRMLDVRSTGTTFLANERTLSALGGASFIDLQKRSAEEVNRAQVCPDFMNAIVLRQPVPHAISLMAEVKFRYSRQLQVKNITSWTPPAWNLTWWETLGPALVGNYATRTLVGRESFCRSAANMSTAELVKAADALLGFDMVMTLHRAAEIDLLVSSLLGWQARKFSGQPAKRVRTVTQAPVPPSVGLSLRRLKAEGAAMAAPAAAAAGGSSSGGGSGSVGISALAEAVGQVQGQDLQSAEVAPFSSSVSSSSKGGRDADRDGSSMVSGSYEDEDEDETGDEQSTAARVAFEQAAAPFNLLDEEPPPALPPEVLEVQAAVALVRASWLERQARLLGYWNATFAAAAGALHEPLIEHQPQRSKHGAHIVVAGLHSFYVCFR